MPVTAKPWANRGDTGSPDDALWPPVVQLKNWEGSPLPLLVTWVQREAKPQGVLGDGADWSTTQAPEHVPDAVKILDWPHLWRTIQAAVRSLQPGTRAARRAWRTRQYDVRLPWLWEGKRDQALTHVHRWRPTTGEVPPPLAEAIGSLETHKDWRGD